MDVAALPAAARMTHLGHRARSVFETGLRAISHSRAARKVLDVKPYTKRGPEGPGVGNMRRREFILALGGAAAAWPLATRAQERVRRIGVLMNLAAGDSESQARHAA